MGYTQKQEGAIIAEVSKLPMLKAHACGRLNAAGLISAPSSFPALLIPPAEWLGSHCVSFLSNPWFLLLLMICTGNALPKAQRVNGWSPAWENILRGF